MLAEVAPLIILMGEPEYDSVGMAFDWLMFEDEWSAISINYTSGTTGDPKGEVWHHGGAYCWPKGNALTTSMQKHAVYLWTLPVFHCNVVIKGYFRNPSATLQAFKGGWFHSGDLGVIHPDGYIRLKDRSKDIIISGGENISSIEVEEVLYSYPCIEIAAVVAMPHAPPCAFIELASGQEIDAEALRTWCRDRLAAYKSLVVAS